MNKRIALILLGVIVLNLLLTAGSAPIIAENPYPTPEPTPQPVKPQEFIVAMEFGDMFHYAVFILWWN